MAITRVGSKKQEQSDKNRSNSGGQTSRARNAEELARIQGGLGGGTGQGGFGGGDKK